jgi:hypothetical protein
MTAHLYISRYH